MPTVRYARTRIRRARLTLRRLDPEIPLRPVLTLYPRYRGTVSGVAGR